MRGMVRRAAPVLFVVVLVVLVVACGGGGETTAEDCAPAAALCRKAESCSPLREPKVKTTQVGEGGASSTITWKSVDDCIAAFASQSCDAAVDRGACQSAIDGSACTGDALVVPSVCLKKK